MGFPFSRKKVELRRRRNRTLASTIHHVPVAIALPVILAGALIIFVVMRTAGLSFDSYQEVDSELMKVQVKNPTQRHEGSWHLDADGNPIKIAYAISLIECTDNHKSGQTSVAGLQDAAIIMRHSIHENSARNPNSGSRYDYEMYAIVHEQAKACAPILEDAGFKIMIRDQPIQQSEIKGAFLRSTIHREVCCGAAEFVKLYALTIPAPLVVHLDIDFIFRKPMDAVFDVMLGATDDKTRSMVEREKPSAPWPANVEATITRDYHSGFPGRNSGFQAGFWIIKPSQKHLDNLVEIVREGNYTDGFGRDNGWGGLGYGGFVGAKGTYYGFRCFPY